MSKWLFSCKLGRAQSTCTDREYDATARGANRWGGCPSCVHREAANTQTQIAETYHAAQQTATPKK